MRPNTRRNINLFSESVLILLVSIVTFFLQAISFATTYSGSKVYLEGVFPYAPLLFALAIQATAYFISNSLRNRITFLRVVAMLVALCCSTYYSYIGIYNSVNSPASFLQENYMRISDELTRIHDTTMEESLSMVRLNISNAYAKINSVHTALENEVSNMEACREALRNIDTAFSNGLRAPKQSSYETYEEYAAAYQAYIAAKSSGSKAEKETLRQDVLSSYGFASMTDLSQKEKENDANLSTLYAALGFSRNAEEAPDFSAQLTALHNNVLNTIDATLSGKTPGTEELRSLTVLLQTAMLCSDASYDLATITNTLHLCSKSSALTVIADYQTLVDTLPEKMVTTGNLMTLKSNMDSQIVTSIITLNSVLPQNEQLSISDPRFQITDLYLVPVHALTSPDTKTTALFCLAVATLIDALSVLFAISIRKKKPIWEKHFLLCTNPEDYYPQICAALSIRNSGSAEIAAVSGSHITALAKFLSAFYPSPETEHDGYMMQADMTILGGFYPLIALLCQINLAKVVPADFCGNANEMVLLRAKFVFWANNLIYEEKGNLAYEESKEVTV